MAELPKARDFFESSSAAVADHELRRKLENASARHLDHVAQVKAEFPPYEDERDAAHRIKTDAIAHLDELLIELTAKLEARGCKVFFAADAAEARDYIVELAKAKGAKNVVKGKSMTTEEIDLNDAFAHGRHRRRRDRPRRVYRAAARRAPVAYHHARDSSLQGRHRRSSSPTSSASSTPPSRKSSPPRRARRLRAIFLAADFGVTGVNFAIAETGTLVVVENEGNGRLSSTMPETFVAVMGIEKVIPAARRPEPFSGNPRAHRDRAEAHDLHQLHHAGRGARASSTGRARCTS